MITFLQFIEELQEIKKSLGPITDNTTKRLRELKNRLKIT